MLLRTSSTPVGQTLFSYSPNKDSGTLHLHDPCHTAKVWLIHDQLHKRSCSCNSLPAYLSTGDLSEFNPKSRRKLFRRAQSDSDLEGLASTSFDLEELYNSKVQNTSLHKPQLEQNKSMLRTEPSFSIYNSNDGVVENNDNGEKLERTVTIGQRIQSLGSREFSFERNGMALIEEDVNEEVEEEEEGKGAPSKEFKGSGIEDEAVNQIQKNLAAGLGADGDGVGGGVNSGQSRFDGNGDVEEYYKRMIREDPSNPLFLRNYAQLLQSKGDLSGAQDYYFQATLADPKDGEILVQYAKLLWELHHDKDRASSYFEKAALAAPEDTNVLGAYASFLWDMDEDEDEDERSSGFEHLKVENGGQEDLRNTVFVEENRPASPPLHLATGLGIDIAGFGGSIGASNYMTTDFADGANTEEYYRMMVEEHPSDPLFLRNFAQFLLEVKGDLQAAEEYYSWATLADPGDGETLSKYAKLIWQLHNDRQKASSYFEQAVQAAPEDSNVLGAYARFLWESEDGEDENNLWKAPLPQGAGGTTNA